MSYKIIAFDLDDTLLNKELKISLKNKEALLKAQSQGVRIVLASGRPTVAMQPIADELELEKHNGYIISYNGAEITDCATNQVIFQKSLTQESIHHLYDLSQSYQINIQTYIDGKIVASAPNPYSNIEHQITGIDLVIPDNFKTAVYKDSVKVILLESHEKLLTIADDLRSKVGDYIHVTFSKPYFLECMDKEVDKALSLKRIAERLAISSKDIIAFGDGHNDLLMIRYAGLGVAMANADPDVQAVADLITTDHNEDGIAQVIETAILKKL